MEIPYQQLEEETLNQIIEEFVLREGTDYGFEDGASSEQQSRLLLLESKVQTVKRQLETGVVRLVFDPDTETCNIIRS